MPGLELVFKFVGFFYWGATNLSSSSYWAVPEHQQPRGW